MKAAMLAALVADADSGRPLLMAPFRVGPWVVATDDKVMVWFPSEPGDEYPPCNPSMEANTARLLEESLSPVVMETDRDHLFAWGLARAPAPPTGECDTCMSTGRVECSNCFGDGECDDCSCGQAHSCGTCDGEGDIACRDCGSGPAREERGYPPWGRQGLLCGRRVDRLLVHRLLEHAPAGLVWIRVHELNPEYPLRFIGEGWHGLVMPLRTHGEPFSGPAYAPPMGATP